MNLLMVLLPLGADQPWNAKHCQTLDVGIVLQGVNTSPATLSEAVSTVNDVRYHKAAQRVQNEKTLRGV
ncbi:MAG: hypothetical protein AAGE93_21595 [Bacteroidota bacterium]